MGNEEFLIVLLIGGVLLVAPLIAIVLSIVAIVKTRQVVKLSARLDGIERYLRNAANNTSETRPEQLTEHQSVQLAASSGEVSESAGAEVPPMRKAVPGGMRSQSATAETGSASPVGWETFIGQKAFGWLAVILFLFSATFFLRYAYQNNWIGPVGRVSIGELVGAGLVIAGYRYLLNGWRRFSNMLMSTGIVVIYLATYSAFGFYNLLSQQHAGIFLAILILESMIVAVFCRSSAIGLVSVIGGLMTPLLMQADHDTYASFFMYLAALNFGVVVALCVQRWRAVGSVAFVGTQFLFWMWYNGNYHPEKFAWALGFQVVMFVLYFAQCLVVARFQNQMADYEDLVRFVVNGILGFIAIRVLTLESWSEWIGTIALLMATVYAVAGKLILTWRPNDHRLLLASLAVSVGFVAWAIPVQADARWIALGWAMMAIALWMFGLRVSSRILRLMAATLACLAVGRLLLFDLPLYVRDPFIPIFNRTAFPSLMVAGLVLAAVWKSDRYLPRLRSGERFGVGVAAVCGTTLLWVLLSLECHGYFVSRSMIEGDVELWRWRAQLALTVFWTVFATAVLFLGFKFERSRLRWFAMVLFGVTVLKLFVVDMANVQQIYRIVAFFILAMVLGLVARSYQRFK
jgi:uncharacterized membrane protein